MRVGWVAALFRTVVAFALAALAAAALGAVLLYSVRIVPFVFAAALAHALLLALPIYLITRRFIRPSWFTCIIAGFLIGAVPFAVATFHPALILSVSGTAASVIGGVRTPAGWHEYTQAVSAFGTFGGAAGFVFWLALRLMGDESPTRRALHPALGALIAAVASAGILSVPLAVADRSCHNPRRIMQQALTPETSILVRTEPGDWPRIVAIFAEFAGERGWSIRVPARDAQHRAMLSMCNDPGTLIRAVDPSTGPIGIQIYQPQGGADWQIPARALVTRLALALPGRVDFLDKGGKETNAPNWFATP